MNTVISTLFSPLACVGCSQTSLAWGLYHTQSHGLTNYSAHKEQRNNCPVKDLFPQNIYIPERYNKSAVLKLIEKLLNLMPVMKAAHMKRFAGSLHTSKMHNTPVQCLAMRNSPLSYWGLHLQVFKSSQKPNCSSPQKKKLNPMLIFSPLGWGEGHKRQTTAKPFTLKADPTSLLQAKLPHQDQYAQSPGSNLVALFVTEIAWSKAPLSVLLTNVICH